MNRETLLDFFADLQVSPAPFLVFDDGFRSWSYSYADIHAAACAFGVRLDRHGLSKGDKVVLWGENRPEWIVAFWGCVLRGVIAVPVDYRSSGEFMLRICGIVGVRLVVVGEDVEAPSWPAGLVVWRMVDLLREPAAAVDLLPAVPIARDDVVEIVFTSGATAEPRGVVITHGNILANIVPIEREVRKYRKWGRPLFPLRFLNLLPLSHLFGQSMATFVPPMLPGTVVFMRGYNSHDIARQVHDRRISVIVCVPKMLDVLRGHILRAAPSASHSTRDPIRWYRRWWHHRDVHRILGWKFWSFVVGAAPLDQDLEEFWTHLGYIVIQGYGLTETAPIVTLNHPFTAKKGSVGKPIHGVSIKLAEDGEILVRGENVTRGYYGVSDTPELFDDGWLRTGDIGSIDADGRVYIRGRKKEMIVTPEGLNVFPEDVERVLLAVPGVVDAAVVGSRLPGGERVHAVLKLVPGADPDAIAAEANRSLADHQRIRAIAIWPGAELPRTQGTQKLKRREIRSWIEGGQTAASPAPTFHGASLEALIGRFAPADRPIGSGTTIAALGLTSLERVELMMAIEERFGTSLDEASYSNARTVDDLRALVTASTAASVTPEATAASPDVIDFPRWSRSAPARMVRRLCLPVWILPLLRAFVWLRVEGREQLDGLHGPVVFAANHQSHLDTPAILAALPARFRYRLATAMAKEFFKAHFFPDQFGRWARLTSSASYYLAALFFNAFPLPQREAGTRQTLRYVGELAGDGSSVLIYPEGRRTEHGEIAPFRSGVGMIGSRLVLPVVPVRLEGLDRILHHTWRIARPVRATIRFGRPLRLEGHDYAALARQVEDAVRSLNAES